MAYSTVSISNGHHSMRVWHKSILSKYQILPSDFSRKTSATQFR